MYYSGDRIREYKVSTENLTEDQIGQLETDLRKPLRILFIVAVLSFVVILYFLFNYFSLGWFIVYLPFLTDFIIEDIYRAELISANIYFWSILLLIWKGHHLVAHYYISSKVKDLEIKNLEVKVKD